MVQAAIDANVDPKSLQKNTSLSTIGSLINQMVGGTMLVLPLLFSSTGIVAGALIMLITGIIFCKGNVIYIEHLKPKEMDFQQTIRRILGNRYEMLFKIVKWLYLFFIIMIYFTLITLQTYAVIAFFLEISMSSEKAEKYYVPTKEENQFVFDRFSIPYMTFITFALCWFMVSIKELSFLVKIAGYGVWTIISFCVFIVYVFFNSMFIHGVDNWSHNVSNIEIFTMNMGGLAGTGAMAFAVHINSASAAKCNKIQENNKRDIIITYICGGAIYELIGVFGSLGVVGMGCDFRSSSVKTITDCFSSKNPATLVVILIYVSHLISAFPIYYNICRTSFIELFFCGKTPSKRVITLIDFFTLAFFMIIQNIPNLKPDDLMALNGSVCCFFYVYFIPLIMDFQCYHGSNPLMVKIKKSMSYFGIIKDEKDRPRLQSAQFQNDRLKKIQEANENMRNERARSQSLENSTVNGLTQSLLNKEDGESVNQNDSNKPSRQNLEVDYPQSKPQEIDSEEFYQRQKDFQVEKLIAAEVQQGIQTQSKADDDEEEEVDQEGQPLYRKESCNYHEADPKYKTALVITYFIIGLFGLAVLFYEIYDVFKQIINAF